jgi:phosphomannomutase
MSKSVKISDLMRTSGVKFGTSGARGLVADMTDEVCYTITAAFIQYLKKRQQLAEGGDGRVAIAGDLRSSTGRIMAAVGAAVADAGCEAVNCGRIPSPAVALYGLQQKIPAIMVTGSHIPDDRNGIKYNTAAGEILKDDEAGIKEQEVDVPDAFGEDGLLRTPRELPEVTPDGRAAYVNRWLDAFAPDHLAGVKLGLYEHSAVARDILFDVYSALGAEVTRLGRSEAFLPVDTEAIRPEDVELAATWAKENAFDAIVSTDGDSDRPLISDENGKWLRGDVAGILCAKFLGADAVATPVSCNSAVDKSGWFSSVRRTRIGSPYVIAEMLAAAQDGARCVVGYEANGGFLTASSIALEKGALEPLPTRDAVIVHLGILSLARRKGVAISQLLAELPQRVTASDRLKEFPTEKSKAKIAELTDGGAGAIEAAFGSFGKVAGIDTTDGLRITFENDEVLHLRPSGNAPELRCYTEADSEDRAREVNAMGIDVLKTWR